MTAPTTLAACSSPRRHRSVCISVLAIMGLWASTAPPSAAQSSTASPAVQAGLLLAALRQAGVGDASPARLRLVVLVDERTPKLSADELVMAFRQWGVDSDVAISVQRLTFRGVGGLLQQIDQKPVDAMYVHTDLMRALPVIQQVTRARKIISMGAAEALAGSISLTVVKPEGSAARLVVSTRAAQLEGFVVAHRSPFVDHDGSTAEAEPGDDAGGVSDDPETQAAIANKVAFLLRLPQFVRWPSDIEGHDQRPIVFGLLGVDPLGQALESAIRRRAETLRPFELKRFDTARAGIRCDILLIASSEQERLDSILDGLGTAAVLTVGDTAGFAERGVIVNLGIRDGRLRFVANRSAARRANLTISSKLLKLAAAVQ